MAVNAKVKTTSIGRVTVNKTGISTIVSTNFKPKPNVSLDDISDVSTVGVQNGDGLVYNSATGRYEAQTITASVTTVIGGTF